jgi:hypothetical protein
MVTIDSHGAFLDKITAKIDGRKIILNHNSDQELLIKAEKELERTFRVSEDRLSDKDKQLLKQAITKVYRYRMGFKL